MAKPTQLANLDDDSEKKPKKKRKGPGRPPGNPILEEYKRTGEIRKGYYLDEKNRIRKLPDVLPDRVDGEVDRLGTMRYVLSNPPECDRTPFERGCREWFRKSPVAFMNALDDLEKAQAAKTAPQASRDEEKPLSDASDKEVRGQIVELLARLRTASQLPSSTS